MGEHATDFMPTRRSLLSRLKRFDDAAGWQQFFDTYGKLIYGVARKAGLTDAEAEDALQDTVIAVSKSIGAFHYDPGKCSFKTWLMALARRRIAQQFGKRPRHFSAVVAAARLDVGGRRGHDDNPRTATIDQVPDLAMRDLEAIWDEEWEK